MNTEYKTPLALLFSTVVNIKQGAEILARYGVRVPLGIACQTVDHVHAAAEKLRSDDGDVVLKSQASQLDFSSSWLFPS